MRNYGVNYFITCTSKIPMIYIFRLYLKSTLERLSLVTYLKSTLERLATHCHEKHQNSERKKK